MRPGRPVRRLIRRQTAIHRVDTERKQPVELRIEIPQACHALPKEIPIERLKMPQIKDGSNAATNAFDLSSITSLANASTVYIRLVDNSTNAANGTGIVGSAGTSRIDNVIVAGTVPGAPSIIAQPQNVTNYFGDTASFTVVAGGNPTLSYQWYTNSTPLMPLTGWKQRTWRWNHYRFGH